jgi:hypothetical protein
MDLQLILRVLWRFRLVVAIGTVLAIVLAVMSYVKINPTGDPKVSYRQTEQWESLTTLFVTSQGFPWGSIGRTDETAAEEAAAADVEEGPTPKGLDPVHLTGLAALYVRLATSDPVLKRVAPDGEMKGTLAAFPVSSDDTGRGSVLPMVTLSAIGETPEQAQDLARRHAKAFVGYIREEQQMAPLPPDERVVVQVVRQPAEPQLLEGRKKTRPMVVFFAVMIIVLGIAFTLENLRPRVRVLPGQEPVDLMLHDASRRSA